MACDGADLTFTFVKKGLRPPPVHPFTLRVATSKNYLLSLKFLDGTGKTN